MNTPTTDDTRKRQEPYLRYRANLLTSERVRELSELRPWIPVFHTFLNWTLIVGAWAACAIWREWWVVVPAIVVVGNRYYSLFIIGHDSFHRRIFKDTRYNDRFADIFINGALGAITRLNKKNHLLHHSLLATEADPDRHKYACSKKARLGQMLGYLTGFTNVWKSIDGVFLRPWREHQQAKNEGDSEGYRIGDLVILLLWQIALIGGLSLSIGWWAYPVVWLFPVYVFTYLADSFRSFCEHSQPMKDDDADKHRLITYGASRIERIFFAPMNMNFHASHHLWTSIPYYNLPVADREIRAKGQELGLEWRSSYIGYLMKYFRLLPLRQCLE